jgi:hypothetical protein
MHAPTDSRALAFLVFCWSVLRCDAALACSCVPQSVAQAKQDAVAIFEGQVTAIAPAPAGGPDAAPENDVTLTVLRSWRGPTAQRTVIVRTAVAGATCGYAFARGARYLVYADGTRDALSVQSCSRTRVVSEASEDLAALGEGVKPRVAAKRSGAPAETRATGCAGRHANTGSPALLPIAASLGCLVRRRRRKQSR